MVQNDLLVFCDDFLITALLTLEYIDDQNEPMYQNDTNMLNNYSHCYVILMAGSKWAKLYIIPASQQQCNLVVIIKTKAPSYLYL